MVARFLFLTLAAAVGIKYSNRFFFFFWLISRNIFVLLAYFFIAQDLGTWVCLVPAFILQRDWELH